MHCGRSRKPSQPDYSSVHCASLRFPVNKQEMYKERFQRLTKREKLRLRDLRDALRLNKIGYLSFLVENIFSAMDKSRNIDVSMSDYLEFLDVLLYGSVQEKAVLFISIITKKKTKQVSFDQFMIFLIEIWAIYNRYSGQEVTSDHQQIRKIFQEIDTDQDELIDPNEYTLALIEGNPVLIQIESIIKIVIEKISYPVLSEKNPLENIKSEIESLLVSLPDKKSKTSVESFHGNEQIMKIQMNDSFEVESAEDSVADIQEKLENLLDKVSVLDQPPRKKYMNNVVPTKTWNTQNWKTLLNLIVGIRKSFLPVDMESISPEHFKEKSEYKLASTPVTPEKYVFKNYAPFVFERIKGMFSISDLHASLGEEQLNKHLRNENFKKLQKQSSIGSNGSFFYYTTDGRFIIKSISSKEKKFLLKFLPSYYEYLQKYPHTFLVRFLGLYKVSVGGSKKMVFVVMHNIFRGEVQIDEQFDLKGWDRVASPTNSPRQTKKDFEFSSLKKRIQIGSASKKLLHEQFLNDTRFLSRSNIAGYSVLVGIHHSDEDIEPQESSVFTPLSEECQGGILSKDQNKIYFLGIIDILNEYGIKKKFGYVLNAGILGNKSSLPPARFGQRLMTYLNLILE